ncbi:MAG: phosphatidylglycerophosphatase A [Gemmatimonadota bacterium]
MPIIEAPQPSQVFATVDQASSARSESRARPTWRWMWSHPWYLLALAGGAGLPRLAPGTWGTLLAWVSFVALDPVMSDLRWGALLLAGVYFGAWAAQRAGEALGESDSRHIVIDEVVAFWIVLWLLPAGHSGWLQALAFALFRAFDIAKPPPIRHLEARFRNGFGVMLDDLVAAFFTLLVIAIGVRVFG